MPVTKNVRKLGYKVIKEKKGQYYLYFKISKETAAHLSGKLFCNWLIMLVTMATPMSSHVKDKNSIFSARDEDMIS